MNHAAKIGPQSASTKINSDHLLEVIVKLLLAQSHMLAEIQRSIGAPASSGAESEAHESLELLRHFLRDDGDPT